VKLHQIIFKVIQEFTGYMWYALVFVFILPYMIILLSRGLDYLIGSAFGVELSGVVSLFTLIPDTVLQLISFAIIAFGVLIILESTLTLARESSGFAFSIAPHYHVNPKKLSQSGWYSKMRHPMAFAYILILVGIGVYIQSLSMVFWFVPLFGGLYLEYLLMVEEKQLMRWFGTEYDSYKTQVPALIPKFRK